MTLDLLRNVAIIAHVDHGKTTLLDRLLYQSGQFRNEDLDKLAGGQHGLIMDSNDLERERGITILAKNCAIQYQANDGNDYRINLIDTPGHADFGGEVERVLKMADGVLLLVDAFEGPMPQTRFVLGKALEHGLKPVVVVNKADRPDARPEDVVNEVFDLLVELDADDAALDFPVIYASAKDGWSTNDLTSERQDMKPVLEMIVDKIPPPSPELFKVDAPLQMLVVNLDYSDYVGRIAIGRIFSGVARAGQAVQVINNEGKPTSQRILKIMAFDGLERKEVKEVGAGDICAIVGLNTVDIGNTIACPENPAALPIIKIDEPTLHMTFRVNNSPFSGRDGKFLTSRQLLDRLNKELQSNVALRVEPGETPEQFHVSGRGLMHLGILIENMRRESFELAVGKPRVIFKEVDGKTQEPIEQLVVDCPDECQNSVMSLAIERRAEIVRIDPKTNAGNYIHMEFTIPSRGLIGMRSRMLNATQGRAIMHHNFSHYEPMRGDVPKRSAGVMISTEMGQVMPYSLDALYDRGIFFVEPGDQVYAGQIVGEHCKETDIVVNVTRNKKFSNVRSSGTDDATRVRPARIMSLEACLEYIQDDELVETTPNFIRIRKLMLSEADRRREGRRGKN